MTVRDGASYSWRPKPCGFQSYLKTDNAGDNEHSEAWLMHFLQEFGNMKESGLEEDPRTQCMGEGQEKGGGIRLVPSTTTAALSDYVMESLT